MNFSEPVVSILIWKAWGLNIKVMVTLDCLYLKEKKRKGYKRKLMIPVSLCWVWMGWS